MLVLAETEAYWHMDLNKVGDAQAQADNLFITQQTAVLLRNPMLNKSLLKERGEHEAARTNVHGVKEPHVAYIWLIATFVKSDFLVYVCVCQGAWPCCHSKKA